MQQLKWIESEGGPLVFIGEQHYKLWSGICNRDAWLRGNETEAGDFMDADQADYGTACEVEGYIGAVDVANGKALVLGDEPAPTAYLKKDENTFILARWIYAADENAIGEQLAKMQLQEMEDWTLETTFAIDSAKSYLFDAATTWNDLTPENEDFLELHIQPGNYKIWTVDFMPDDETHIVLHRFERTTEA